MKSRSLTPKEIQEIKMYPFTDTQKERITLAWQHIPTAYGSSIPKKKTISFPIYIISIIFGLIVISFFTSYTFENICIVLGSIRIFLSFLAVILGRKMLKAPFPYDIAILSKTSIELYLKRKSFKEIAKKIGLLIMIILIGVYYESIEMKILSFLWVFVVGFGEHIYLSFERNKYMKMSLNGQRDELVDPQIPSDNKWKKALHKTYNTEWDKENEKEKA